MAELFFFHLQPKKAILGDSNSDLITTYRAIKKDWKAVYQHLKKHNKNHDKDYYYKIRAKHYNTNIEKAAKFIYLNRTCWNGLYRVNMKGQFNVPLGSKNSVIHADDDFSKVSKCLKEASLHNKDFEFLIDRASDGDLVFVDPPYTVRHNKNGFVQYNEKIFSWNDQERLFYALHRAKKRGAQIVGTNAYHDSVKDLYGDTFELSYVSRSSNISPNKDNRKKFNELLITT